MLPWSGSRVVRFAPGRIPKARICNQVSDLAPAERHDFTGTRRGGPTPNVRARWPQPLDTFHCHGCESARPCGRVTHGPVDATMKGRSINPAVPVLDLYDLNSERLFVSDQTPAGP